MYALTATAIILRDDGASIPTDPGNTDYQVYLAWVAAGNTPTPYTPPAPTPASLAAAALAAGLTITSTSTPALNGTYACDTQTTLEIAQVDLYVLQNGTFPGGMTSYPWTDATGGVHVFPNITLYKEWAVAIANFVAACKLAGVGAGALPSNSAVIA